MKRNLLLAFALSVCILSKAQNQNWTATSIDGNTYDIAAMLDSGKTVLVDISAYWCMPCWDWHQTGIMEKIYQEFGPNGTNDLRIFFIDADAGSTMAGLQGSGAMTMGNWIEGTPYPIIGPYGQGSSVASHYNLSAYPTLFMHCPGDSSGIVVPITATLEQFLDTWKNSCPVAFDNGSTDAMLWHLDDAEFCTGEHPVADLFNQGMNTLTSATLELRNNGTLLDTKNWTGVLAPFQHEKVSFDNYAMTVPMKFEKTVIVSGDNHAEGNTETDSLTLAPLAPNVYLTLDLQCDASATQTSWKLFDSNDLVVAESPATPYTYHQFNSYDWVLSPNSCYTFKLYDTGGNGICCGFGQGYYNIRNTADSLNYFVYGGHFDRLEEDRSFLTPSLTAGINHIVSVSELTVYPNPSSGTIKIKNNTGISGSFNLYDINGKKIMNGNIGTGDTDIDMGSMTDGIYSLSVTTQKHTEVNRIVLIR